MVGFEQTPDVADVRARHVGLEDADGMRARPRRELHARAEPFVGRDILRRDPVRARVPLRTVLRLRKPLPARAAPGVAVVLPGDLGLVRDEVVVEDVRRAEVEAARIGEKIKPLPVRVTPHLRRTHRRTVAVQLALEVVAVEDVGEILHPFDRPNLHVDRGARPESRKVVLHELRDKRRGRRHRRERAVGREPLDRLADLRKETLRERPRAVAVRVEEEIEAKPRIGKPPQILQLAVDVRHRTASGRHRVEGDVAFV